MKRILVTSAGGSAATNFVRSLRASTEEFYLIGTDCSEFHLQRAETDEKHLVPRADEDCYLDILNDILIETKTEFLHIQNDAELNVISQQRDRISAMTFLPQHRTIEICQNKFESYEIWKRAGIKQPRTIIINKEADLKNAFHVLGEKVWIRAVSGAGGSGSIAVDSYEFAKAWIDFKNGWSSFTAAECLQPYSVTWSSIWDNGELVIAQGRKRLYWELSGIAPSGVTGVTGAGVSLSDHFVDEISKAAILAIDGNPNGIFSVDLTLDYENRPNPTEINAGRFFTTHEFFTRAGLNMPYFFVKLAYGEELPQIGERLNPLKSDLVWIRGVDFKPVLVTMSDINRYNQELKRRKQKPPRL